ncbi:MAG: hypothetical protein JO307_05760 [Bryobacterales bacterium]|nr:hypothetical protein [Bryobacterales bacterium]
MSKVLIVSYYFPPFNGPGAQHPDFFFRFLREEGFETTAVTSAVYYNPNAAPPELVPRGPGVSYLPERGWVRALCPRLYKTEMQIQVRRGRWQPGFLWAKLFAVGAAERLLARGGSNVMISVSPPVSSHWAALKLKKRFPKLFWIADFQDPFVGNPFDAKSTDRERRFERELFSLADVLSANTDTAMAMWRERYPEFAGKMIVTWGGYDPEEEVRALPLGSSAPVLSHVGVIFGARVPAALLASIARLSESRRLKRGDLVAEFVGDLDFGALAGLAQKLAAEGWVRMRPIYVPRAEALRVAGQAHYSLLLDITPGDANLQAPAKLFDQIRIGRPVLAFTAENSPAGRILERSGIAHVRLRPDDLPERVDAGVLELLRMSSEPQQASEWFRETFDARRQAAVLGGVIRRGGLLETVGRRVGNPPQVGNLPHDRLGDG